jgi:hypothetical protein
MCLGTADFRLVAESSERKRSRVNLKMVITDYTRRIMKKFLLGTFVMVAGLFALASGARAESNSVVTIHVNQDFIAGGKALSAGTYKVYQGSPETRQWLILRNKETGASAFLLPTAHDETVPRQFQAQLTRAANVYYLSEVVTDLGVYTFSAPRALTPTAKNRDHDKMATSKSNGAESAAVTE